MRPKDVLMLNDSSYYTLYLAKMRRDELLQIAEIDRINRKARKRKTVVSQILEEAGNTLISAGNRLKKIA